MDIYLNLSALAILSNSSSVNWPDDCNLSCIGFSSTSGSSTPVSEAASGVSGTSGVSVSEVESVVEWLVIFYQISDIFLISEWLNEGFIVLKILIKLFRLFFDCQ